MLTRAVDSDNDFRFGKGRQDYLEEKEGLAQNIKTRLLSFFGDCFFDLEAGIDWFNYLGSKNINGLKLAVANVILETYGVQALKELSFSLDTNRQLLITYEVQSLWSETIAGQAVLG